LEGPNPTWRGGEGKLKESWIENACGLEKRDGTLILFYTLVCFYHADYPLMCWILNYTQVFLFTNAGKIAILKFDSESTTSSGKKPPTAYTIG
jgi:hypothetical protein